MKINKSKSYLVPLLDTEVKVEYPNLLINSYISDYTISLLYQYDSSTTLTSNGRVGFPTYETYLTSHQNFLEKTDIDLDNIPCVLYTFMFPVSYYPEFNYFCSGQFSMFSEKAKRTILRFLQKHYSKQQDTVVLIKQILYKDSNLRTKLEQDLKVNISENLELSSKPDLMKELYEQR